MRPEVFLSRLCSGAMAYGFARGLYYSTQLEHVDTHKRMPFGTAATFVIGTVGMAPLAFPGYLVYDANYMDRRFFMKQLSNRRERDTFPSVDGYLLPNMNSGGGK